MMLKRSIAAAAASVTIAGGAAFGIVSAGSAGSAAEPTDPCERQQTQLDRAVAKRAALQAIFLKQKKELNRAEKALERADTRA